MELLIGSGSARDKRLFVEGRNEWTELVTLDIEPAHQPHVVWDLNERPLPFDDGTFDEIHAYEVLEHLGRQGDYRAFFAEWEEWWRLLKPGGLIIGTSPHWSSKWAWGDPGHTRIVSPESLVFLVQPEYARQVSITPMSDYRSCYRADFDIVHCKVDGQTFQFGLRAVKPARIA